MKKSIVCLILVLFLITGCSTNYNLVIDNDSISESIDITIPTSVINDYNIYQSQVTFPRRVNPESSNTYKMTQNEDANNYYVNYSYTHDINNYKNSNFISKCYQKRIIENNEDTISIKTNDRFDCIIMEDGFYMDNVKINITTNLKVLENNADEINANIYTWNINKNNYTNKPINLKLEKNKSVLEKVKQNVNKIQNKSIGIILLCLIASGIAISKFMKVQYKKHNKI